MRSFDTPTLQWVALREGQRATSSPVPVSHATGQWGPLSDCATCRRSNGFPGPDATVGQVFHGEHLIP